MTAGLIHLQVALVGGESDSEAIAESVLALGDELAELDVEGIEPATAGEVPAGAKGVELLALGGLVVELARSSRVLREVVDAIRGWVDRTGTRSVKVAVGDDVLEIMGASSDDITRLIDAWVERHSES